jgi:hypothetical protein
MRKILRGLKYFCRFPAKNWSESLPGINKCENEIHNLYSKLNTMSIYSLIRDINDKPGKDAFWPQFVQNLSVVLKDTPQFGHSTTSLLLLIKALKKII